jgi:chitin-binding protein
LLPRGGVTVDARLPFQKGHDLHIKRRLALLTALALAVTGAVVTIEAGSAQAHGAMMQPGSRQYLCWKDAVGATGAIAPTNPACAAAIAKSGPNMIYNWFGDLRSNAGGRNEGYLPDGQVCSGGSPASDAPYDFSGYNLPRSDWPITHLTSGASFNWTYNDWAKHPGTFKMWVTKNGYDPNTSLSWSDLDAGPFLSVTDPPANGGPGTNDGNYYWTANLPSGKTGHHIIFSQWVRSDSQENFFTCSDVVFDGGHGEVSMGGLGSGGGSTTTTTTAGGTTTTTRATTTTTRATTTTTRATTTTTRATITTTRATTTTTRPTTTTGSGGGTGACTASFSAPNPWSGGFVATVTVTAGSTALSNWKVTVNLPSGAAVSNSWSATQSGTSGTVTFANAAYNGTLGAGASTSFGFQGTGSPSGTTVSCST